MSGPGAGSQRTDGGPGQKTRVAPAEYHGQRQELENQQAAAPLATASSPTTGGAAAAGQPDPAEQSRLDALRAQVWGPSTGPRPRPMTPMAATDRADLEVETMLRTLYQRFPNSDIGRLLPR